MNAALPTVADALALAAAGWEVLPCEGKVPATTHGVKDATRDPVALRRMFARPRNIGARVPAGLLVLDFDPRNGGTVETLENAARVRLPDTLTVHSGRGDGGQHRYFLHPDGEVSASRLPAGIDVKKHTGYCMMPPSIHPATGRPYRWEVREPVRLPDPVLQLLRPAPSKHYRYPAPPTGSASGARATARADALVRQVAYAPEGRRNETLYWAACRAVEDNLGAATLERLADSGRAVGLSEREVSSVITSASRQGASW